MLAGWQVNRLCCVQANKWDIPMSEAACRTLYSQCVAHARRSRELMQWWCPLLHPNPVKRLRVPVDNQLGAMTPSKWIRTSRSEMSAIDFRSRLWEGHSVRCPKSKGWCLPLDCEGCTNSLVCQLNWLFRGLIWSYLLPHLDRWSVRVIVNN